jgi:hypothetical protein
MDQLLDLGLFPALLPCLFSNHLKPNSDVIAIYSEISDLEEQYYEAINATNVLSLLFQRYKFDPRILFSLWTHLITLVSRSSSRDLKEILNYALSYSDTRRDSTAFLFLLSDQIELCSLFETALCLCQCFAEVQIGQVILSNFSSCGSLQIRENCLRIIHRLLRSSSTRDLVDIPKFLMISKSMISRSQSDALRSLGSALWNCVVELFLEESVNYRQLLEDSELISHLLTEDVEYYLAFDISNLVDGSIELHANEYLDDLVRSGVISYLISSLKATVEIAKDYITNALIRVIAYAPKYRKEVQKMEMNKELKDMLMQAADRIESEQQRRVDSNC